MNARFKSSCGDCDSSSIRFKVYNLHKSFWNQYKSQSQSFRYRLGWKQKKLLAFTLRNELFSESFQVIADAAREFAEPPPPELIVVG